MSRGVFSQTLKPVVKFNLFPNPDMLIFHRTISLQTTLVPRHSAIAILSCLGTQGHCRCRLDRIKINIGCDIQIGCQPILDVKRAIGPGINIGCDMKIGRQTRRDIQIKREFRRQVNVGRDSNIGREIGRETQIRRALGRAIQIGREIETVYTCLWAGLHPRANKFQQTSLPNFHATRCPVRIVSLRLIVPERCPGLPKAGNEGKLELITRCENCKAGRQEGQEWKMQVQILF